MKTTTLIGLCMVMAALVMLSGTASANDWIIDGDKVYYNDSHIYLSAEPHTLHESGWVTFNLTSWTYTGDTDFVWGFDTSSVRPQIAELAHPHWHNWTTQHSVHLSNVTDIQTCPGCECDVGNEYNNIKRNVTVDIGGVNSSHTVYCFDSYNETAPGEYDIFWNTTHSEWLYWLDWTDKFSSVINHNHGGMNKWYPLHDVSITAGNSYSIRVWVDIPWELGGDQHKYWWAAKPHSESISEAISAGHFYALDPWYSSAWSHKRQVLINNTAGTDLAYYQINVSLSPGINATSIRVVNDTASTTVPYWCENVTDGDCYELWFNATHIPADAWCNDTYYIYYGNDAVGTASDYDSTFTKESDEPYYMDACTFDGVNDYVDCGNDASLNLNNDFTITAWIKAPDEFAGLVTMWGEEAMGKRRSLFVYRDQLLFSGYGAAANIDSGIIVADDIWHHCVVTVNNSDFVMTYVDGVAGYNNNFTTLVPYNYTGADIGRSISGTEYFGGSIGEVRIYNRTLTPSEVKQSHLGTHTDRSGLVLDIPFNESSIGNATTTIDYSGEGNDGAFFDTDETEHAIYEPSGIDRGLVLELHMDEGTGNSVAVDSSGFGNNGTLTNMNTAGDATSGWQGTDGGQWNGRSDMVFASGDHLRFDGGDDYVNVPHDGSISFGTGDFTLSAMVYFIDLPATDFPVILGKGDVASGEWMFRALPASNVGFYAGGVTTETAVVPLVGNWTHCVFVRDGDDGYIYIDGVEAGNSTGLAAQDFTTTKTLRVANADAAAHRFLNGSVDEVRIYNRALSEGEIYRQYIRSKYAADAPTATMGEESAYMEITLHSVSPETIHTNHTGQMQVNYIVESTNPLNLSSLAFLYGVNYTTTGDMHSYIAAPPNSIAEEGIYRAPNRNTTPYLSWENNATITEGNIWQWGGGDNESWWITKTPINATHTWINATGIPEHVFQSSFYLNKMSMYSAPKTAFEVNGQQGIIIKMWDNEIIRGRSLDYFMNIYFDTAWESTIPTDPIEIWYCNSSFNPDTDDPTGANCFKVVEWVGNRWVNHSWVPGSNASYATPLTLNASGHAVTPDEINYIYLKSDTQASKSYVLNATDYDPGICNLTYAQTNTMWTYSELAGLSTQVAHTPSFFATFVRDDEQFLHHMYIADDQGEWAHSGINNISIGVSHYPVPVASIDYFNITCPTFGYTHDTSMTATYDNGYIHVGTTCPADPDGGIVSHNLTIHYTNETIAGIVNNTFTTTGDESIEINFTTSTYYSTSDAYTLKCVSTDDEGSVATTWLGSTFTLAADGTQGYYMNDYLMFWGMNDIPTLYASVANDSLISYNAGTDIYTMHVPFFKSKCNDTFRFNETVHLKSLNTEDVAYFRFGGETIFDNANIHGWNTVSDTAAPLTDTYRGYMYSCCRTTGNITNSNLSHLGSDVYRQEGINFIDNDMEYLIYNTTFSHNSRGIILEECENFDISHCNVHANAETGIGIYYSNSITVENCTISDSAYDPGLYLYEARNNMVKYNTILDCADHGMRIRSNSNNNTLIGNDITGSGGYDYYFSSSAINNTIRDPASTTDNIRVTSTSEVNIENTDNYAFTEDSLNSTYAYPANFSIVVDSVSQTFDITQRDMTVTPASDSIQMWNLVWANSVSFNASNVSGAPQVWFNTTQSIWENANMTVYRNGTVYYNGTADANGTFTYNYSGGWSGHWFVFAPGNIAPDKPTVVTPANGATGTSTNPMLTVQVTDGNSADLLNVTFYAQGGAQIGSTQTGITNGSTASVTWSGRSYSTTYYWYAVADDDTAQTQSDTWNFGTQTSGGDGGGSGGSSHVILISGCTDWEGNAGTQVYIDFGCTGETGGATFTTNATNGSINPSNGVYTWNTVTADAGTYTWRFNVENVYSVSDYCDVTITVYHYASPTNLAATTGNFWVNHTWGGNGFMDSYNVSVNDVWVNGSANKYSYHVRYPHAWSNISVAAYNDTSGLSSFISNDVQVPNNPIVLTNYSVLMLAAAGDNVTVDMNHEDLDGDTATYYCSRMDLFTDFNTADGTGQYTNAINGTHEVIFGVTDGYGWDNQTITIEVGTVHPLELDEETPLILFVVLVVLLFGSLFYIYHAASYVAKIVTSLISTWMSFMLSNMAVSGNVVINYAELSAGDVFIYGAHSIQIAALSHFFMFTGVLSALFMLVFAVKLVIDTYLDMQEKKIAEDEWDGVE